jgi:hypothetical protein
MGITLQSSVGDFSPEFMRRLARIERDMVKHGLEPSEFVISKDYASPSSLHVIGPFFFEYSVFVGEDSFTVTEPNDMLFLDFFHQRCIAAEAEEEEPQPTLQPTEPGPIRRFLRWMNEPI